MNLSNERRIVSNIIGSLYQVEREIKEALNHSKFVNDFGEVYLSIARVKGQLEVLSCKFNALSE